MITKCHNLLVQPMAKNIAGAVSLPALAAAREADRLPRPRAR